MNKSDSRARRNAGVAAAEAEEAQYRVVEELPFDSRSWIRVPTALLACLAAMGATFAAMAYGLSLVTRDSPRWLVELQALFAFMFGLMAAKWAGGRIRSSDPRAEVTLSNDWIVLRRSGSEAKLKNEGLAWASKSSDGSDGMVRTTDGRTFRVPRVVTMKGGGGEASVLAFSDSAAVVSVLMLTIHEGKLHLVQRLGSEDGAEEIQLPYRSGR